TNNHNVSVYPPPTSSSSPSTTSSLSNQPIGSTISATSNLKSANSLRKDKTTRMRTVLNEKQLLTLRTCYGANPRPDASMKERLVEMTELSPRVIRVWFQNKRCKDKKRTILTKQTQEQQKVLTSMNRGISLVASSPVSNDVNIGLPPASIVQVKYHSSGSWKSFDSYSNGHHLQMQQQNFHDITDFASEDDSTCFGASQYSEERSEISCDGSGTSQQLTLLKREKEKKASEREHIHSQIHTYSQTLNQSKYLERVSINMSIPANTKPIFPECFGCKLSINDPSFLSVTPGIHWHDECLRCRICKQKLDERTTCFMDRYGFPYCKHDYSRRFYYQCFACQKHLLRNDLIQRAKSNVYHADCFRCEACRKCLQAGDEFTLSGDNRILCRNDFDSLTNNNSNETLKALDCPKLTINELTKVNQNNETPLRTNASTPKKKSSRISTNNKIHSSIDDMDSNDERHKSTDDSSSLSPNGSSSQQLNPGTSSNNNNNSAERRPRRDKQQRVRTVLTEKQLHLLKSCYAYNARPDALLKEQLAEMTELSPRVIRVWFQNKRCKDKKKTAAQQSRFPGDPKRHRLDITPMPPLGPNGESFLLGHPMNVLSPCNSQGGGQSTVNGTNNMYEGGSLQPLQSIGSVNTNGPFLNTRDGMMYSLSSSPPSNSDDSYVMGPHGPLQAMSCPSEWIEHHPPQGNDYHATMPMFHPVNINEDELEDQDMMMPVEDDSLDQTNSDFSDG
ncbi:unnamed protein product, partial [Rotaria magnacalcarata]